MHAHDTLIVGGGQAGLALSRHLTSLGLDHVVVERGRVAERWRTERWRALRLLTPNWMTRLPAWRYRGHDPDGFMDAAEVADFLSAYASSFAAPVRDGIAVRRVVRRTDGFHVATDDGTIRCRNVVVATGWCDRPMVPLVARQLSPALLQITPDAYWSPADLPAGGVLVVGASATGVQLADELRRSGRDVTIAVGRHGRMPRRYRGMDIFWWLDQIGAFDRTIDDVADPVAARAEPSLQVVGRADRRSVDLAALQADGVRVVGRVLDVDGTTVRLADDLDRTTRDADVRMRRLLRRIDDEILRRGLDREVLAPAPMPSVRPLPAPPRLDLRATGIETVVWATGHRRSYDWLRLPIFDDRGEIVQHRGVTRVPGAYVLGLRFQHHRSSNFIDGVGRDARFVADHICRASGARVDHVPRTAQRS